MRLAWNIRHVHAMCLDKLPHSGSSGANGQLIQERLVRVDRMDQRPELSRERDRLAPCAAARIDNDLKPLSR